MALRTIDPNDSSRRPTARPTIISIEAAIGTGKSTLLKLIQSRCPNWVVVQEPVDLWQNVGGEHNLLGHFYENPERFAFSFQTFCVLSRIESVTKAVAECPSGTKAIILERSWFSDRHTFAEMLHKSGRISNMEWCLYDQWYKFAVKNSPRIDGHVYLDCSVDTCMKRLHKRNRSEESAVTTDYQKALIQHHEDWLKTIDPAMVCRVDVDRDFLGDEARSAEMLLTLQHFVDGAR
jgi:deoxyadenosine/deoxycytidine kinase